MFYQFFFSPQVKVKRIMISSNKHGIYELPHQLPKDLRKLVNIKKIGNLNRFIA